MTRLLSKNKLLDKKGNVLIQPPKEYQILKRGKSSVSILNEQKQVQEFLNISEREKYLLPATQPEVEKIYKKEKIYKQISEIRRLIEDLKVEETILRDKIYTIDLIKDEKEENPRK
jgi:hypothetical protein